MDQGGQEWTGVDKVDRSGQEWTSFPELLHSPAHPSHIFFHISFTLIPSFKLNPHVTFCRHLLVDPYFMFLGSLDHGAYLLFWNYLSNICFSQLIVNLSDLRTGTYQANKIRQAEIILLNHFFKSILFGQNHEP